MRTFLLLCLVAVALAKKHHAGHKKAKVPEAVEEGVADLAEAKDALDKLTYTKEEQILDAQEEKETGYHNTVNNPCADIDCGSGQVCALDASWNPFCKCLDICPTEAAQYSVCSTQNITYTSWCEFHRQKCSRHGELAKVVVEYYGVCKEITTCEDKEMEAFPERMREWFREVMLELSLRPINEGGLSDDEVDEEREAERDPNPFMRPIHWNFRRLDTNPADLYLTHEELTSLRAPLMQLEHCTKPFFTQCDVNQDGMISLEEWGLCLGLTRDEIQY
ncbi:SPARC-like [Amphiura filiformis]|uniref:SPARC-like n=1 Tax=Amphiura filiformis TaxID=82378 RepID=UPI003B220333